MDLCDDLKIPANTYISGLIETDLKKRKSDRHRRLALFAGVPRNPNIM